MAEPFLSEVRIMSFGFAPRGWALCNGQLLPINQNQALFSLLGTTFGGDGRVNFALPDLRGRTPIHANAAAYSVGTRGGEQAHSLSVAELPIHQHTQSATSKAGDAMPIVPAGNLLAQPALPLYGKPENLVAMAASTIGTTGGSQPHSNMQPYLTLSFCIALQGIFPSPN